MDDKLCAAAFSIKVTVSSTWQGGKKYENKNTTNHQTRQIEVLATILNDGKSPTTGAQILRPDTIAEMFKNQIPHLPDFARQGIPAAKPDLTNPIAEIYPVEGRPPQGWGLTFLQPIGAEAGTVCWAGLPNLWWWLNREKGIAGLVATQILPFVDPKVMALWFGVQGASYAALG